MSGQSKKETEENKEIKKGEQEVDAQENVADDKVTNEEGDKKKDDKKKKSKESSAEKKCRELEKELEEMHNKHMRLIAEYDNYRKRTLKEKMELSKLAGEKIFGDILPVIDDFERALLHLDDDSDITSVKEGVELIYNKFLKYLSSQGVKEIKTDKEEFNADIHEAVTKIPAPSDDLKGKIVDCVQKGYILDEKVIRYPKVVVGE
ncbi:nucleotide exchange factor GrpE [Marinilabiliaceae bacterium ANBcel2]|nr:nucleotide exchange factor GrpE [Marinilabiliaceae bacterium ANBcel2]